MPRNGSGVYSLPQPPFVAGTVISSAAVNSDFNDIANALTASLPRDGQAGMSGALKLPDGSTTTPSLTFNNDLTTGFTRGIDGSNNSEIGVNIIGVNLGNFTTTGWTGPVTGKITGTGSIQPGTIVDFAGATAPTGWYLCFGQAISRTTYASLFAAIGTTYGSGDGSTTFNVPDLRGSTTFGKDNMGGSAAGRLTTPWFGTDPTILGDRGGAQNIALVANQIPVITSNVSVTFISVTSNVGNIAQGSNTIINQPGTGSPSAFPSLGYSAVTSNGTGSGNATSNNAGGAAHPLVNPALIMNKIIYAGV